MEGGFHQSYRPLYQKPHPQEILPAVEKRINPGAGANILRMGKLAAMADSYLRQQAGRWLEIWALDENNGTRSIFLPEKPFKEADAILQLYAVMEVLKELAGSSKDLGLVHGQAAAELFDRQPGRRIDLPYGLEARREYGGYGLGNKSIFWEEQGERGGIRRAGFSSKAGFYCIFLQKRPFNS